MHDKFIHTLDDVREEQEALLERQQDPDFALASDYAGFAYKMKIRAHLEKLGHQVRDFGTDSEAPVNYPDFIRPAAEAVSRAADS